MHSSSFPSSSLGTHVLEALLRNQLYPPLSDSVSNKLSTQYGKIDAGCEHEYVINPKKVPQEPVVRPKVNPAAGATNQHNSSSGIAARERLAPMCEEVISNHDFTEGKAVQVLVNRFERDEKARRLCLAHFGLSCQCCGFQSRVTYDDSVTVIHVHHKAPLSGIRSEYHPNSSTDLIPLCSNCHAVVHRRNPPLEIDDVRRMLANKRAK